MADDLRPAGWSSPDVQPVGWVDQQPHTTVRRKRSVGWLLLGSVLLVGATIAMVVSIVGLVASAGPDDDEIVAEGVVAPLGGTGESVTFTAGGAEPFTVWIDTDGILESNRRENVVAATYCVAQLAGGGDTEADFQGNRQGSSITIGDESTVGWFTAAEGPVEIRCEQRPFGQRRTRSWLDDEHPFLVVPGKPASTWVEIVVLAVGTVVLLVGIAAFTRGVRGRIVTDP